MLFRSEARIKAVAEDANLKLLLTNRQNYSLASQVATNACRLVEFETVDSKISAENLCLTLSPRALSLIVYTSGSTGQPKGVIDNHRNMLHRAMRRSNLYHICELDRLCLLTSGTSNTVTFTFVTLLNGADRKSVV